MVLEVLPVVVVVVVVITVAVAVVTTKVVAVVRLIMEEPELLMVPLKQVYVMVMVRSLLLGLDKAVFLQLLQ